MNETTERAIGLGTTQIGLTNPALYGRGWNELEPYGCWSSNRFSKIQLRVASAVEHLQIECSFVLLEEMPRPQILRLWVGRTCLFNELITDETEKTCSVRLTKEHFLDGSLDIRFYLSFLRLNEEHIPLLGDPRKLGLKLFNLVAEAR